MPATAASFDCELPTLNPNERAICDNRDLTDADVRMATMLHFLTGLFGVNLAGMPGGNWPGAFAALCAGTVVLGVALWFFFRWKRWF